MLYFPYNRDWERICFLPGTFSNNTWRYDPTIYAPPRYQRACDYFAFVPDALQNFTLSLPGDIGATTSEAETSIAALNGRNDPALLPLARLLLRTESIASSKVEGMQVDARTLARAEVKRDSGKKVSTEALEVMANIDAMQFAIESVSNAPAITPDHLASIHRVLLERAPNKSIAGRIRTRQNWIGGNDYNPCGADFVPPPAEDVPRLLDDLCNFCNKNDLSPLVQAAIAHAQFETIHPFDDGNGRTGRALIQVILRRRGIAPTFVPPISVVLAKDRDAYVRGLTAFREHDHATEWITLFASTTVRAARLADRYMGQVTAMQNRWRDQLRNGKPPRADAAAWAILDVLPIHPVITIPMAVVAARRTKPAISVAIRDLVDAGVLKQIEGSQRFRAWEAVGLLDLLNGLEDET
jgi:Fic family protein